MNYEDFIKANLGKPVEREDISNPDQCMDYAFAYLDDVLHVDRATIRHQFARQVWDQATDLTKQFFDLIPNTPTGTPVKGDLVIFGTEVGVAGHICVATGNNDGTKTFQSTDENWNGHSYVEFIWHTYGGKQGVLGWLRPKTIPNTTTVSLDSATFEKLKRNSEVTDAINAYFSLPQNSDFLTIKAKLDALNARPTSCPPVDPKYLNACKSIQQIINNLG